MDPFARGCIEPARRTGRRASLPCALLAVALAAAPVDAKFQPGAEGTIGPLQFDDQRWQAPQSAVLAALRRRYEYRGWRAGDGRHHFRGTWFGWPDADITPAFWGERLYRVEVLLPYPPGPAEPRRKFVSAFFDRLGTRFGGTTMRETVPDARFVYRQLRAHGQLGLENWRMGAYDRPTPVDIGDWHLLAYRGSPTQYLSYWSTELLAPAGVPDGYEFVFATNPRPRLLAGRATAVERPDVIGVDLAGKAERVRLIGLGADGRWTPAALARMRALVEGRTVHCELEEQARDEAGRLLAHVFVGKVRVEPNETGYPEVPRVQGTSVNAVMLGEGLARHVHGLPNIGRYERYEEAQEEAKKARKGLWAAASRR